MRVICQLLVIPRVRMLEPDKSRGLFQLARKFGKMMTGIMKKKCTDLQLHFRRTSLSMFVKRFVNWGLKNTVSVL